MYLNWRLILVIILVAVKSAFIMYQSIPSQTIPGRLPGIRTFLPLGRVFAQLSLFGASGFWIREISNSFERQMQELLDLFQRNRSS